MITFENGLDIRTRFDVCGKPQRPQVARFDTGNGEYRYICIGTDYGHIHTSGGGVRTWKSYSGARRFLTRYLKEPQYKLTLVSVSFRGKKLAKFVRLPYVNGRARCPIELLDSMASELGCQKGMTYSHG